MDDSASNIVQGLNFPAINVKASIALLHIIKCNYVCAHEYNTIKSVPMFNNIYSRNFHRKLFMLGGMLGKLTAGTYPQELPTNPLGDGFDKDFKKYH